MEEQKIQNDGQFLLYEERSKFDDDDQVSDCLNFNFRKYLRFELENGKQPKEKMLDGRKQFGFEGNQLENREEGKSPDF